MEVTQSGYPWHSSDSLDLVYILNFLAISTKQFFHTVLSHAALILGLRPANSAVCTHVSGQWPTLWRSLNGQWGVSLGHHMLVMVSAQGTNKPLGLTKSFIKSQNSTACILSFVMPIQLKYMKYFSSSQNFEMTQWATALYYCHRVEICNFTINKQGPSHYFHLHARAPPMAMPYGWVYERMRDIVTK